MELGFIAAGAIIKLFLIVLIGFLAVRLKFIDENGTKTLANLVNRVANPLKLFTSYLIVYDAVQFRGLALAAALSLLTYVVSISLSLIFFRKKGDYWRIDRLCSTFSNCGFMGIPLISAVLGNEAVFYLTGVIFVHNVMSWTYGISVVKGESDVKKLPKTLLSPTIICIFAGLIIYLLQIPVPSLVSESLESVGNCASALAMLVSGATIAGTKWGETLRRKASWLVVFIKLILGPLLYAFICSFIDLPDMVFMTVFISFSCPVATVIVTQAVTEDCKPGHASALLAMTTILSMVTLPSVIAVQQWMATVL